MFEHHSRDPKVAGIIRHRSVHGGSPYRQRAAALGAEPSGPHATSSIPGFTWVASFRSARYVPDALISVHRLAVAGSPDEPQAAERDVPGGGGAVSAAHVATAARQAEVAW